MFRVGKKKIFVKVVNYFQVATKNREFVNSKKLKNLLILSTHEERSEWVAIMEKYLKGAT